MYSSSNNSVAVNNLLLVSVQRRIIDITILILIFVLFYFYRYFVPIEIESHCNRLYSSNDENLVKLFNFDDITAGNWNICIKWFFSEIYSLWAYISIPMQVKKYFKMFTKIMLPIIRLHTNYDIHELLIFHNYFPCYIVVRDIIFLSIQ